MKLIKLVIALALIQWSVASCEREADLEPTPELEGVYGDPTLPQGNHDYDTRIVAMFKTYKTMFLYKYLPHDLYWNVTQWKGGTYDPVRDTTYQANGNYEDNGYFDTPADENYVGQQLNMLDDIWLDFYPDKYLIQCLPHKVYLLDSLYRSMAKKGTPNRNVILAYSGGDFIAATWGGARILQMTPAEKIALKNAVNTIFMGFATRRGGAVTPGTFRIVSNYQTTTIPYNENGFLNNNINNEGSDWTSYLNAIVTTPYSKMIAIDGSATGGPGILHPDFDTKGLIQRKYDIVIDFFKTVHGFDLQAVGNATFE